MQLAKHVVQKRLGSKGGMKGSTLLLPTLYLLMKVERIAQTSPAEALVVMWHHHLSSVTSSSKQGCHREQCDWCNLTHHVTVPDLPAGKLWGKKEERKRKRKKASEKKSNWWRTHGQGVIFVFRKGCVACRSQKSTAQKKENWSRTNQWANRFSGGLDRPSRVEKGTKQVRNASFHVNLSETLCLSTEGRFASL